MVVKGIARSDLGQLFFCSFFQILSEKFHKICLGQTSLWYYNFKNIQCHDNLSTTFLENSQSAPFWLLCGQCSLSLGLSKKF